jgi:hypothetical protein
MICFTLIMICTGSNHTQPVLWATDQEKSSCFITQVYKLLNGIQRMLKCQWYGSRNLYQVWKTWRSHLASDWRERDSALVSGWINVYCVVRDARWSSQEIGSHRKLEKFVDLYCYWHLDHSKKSRSLRWYHILLSILATMLKFKWRTIYRWWTRVWWYGYIATLLY